tara:strand:- start:1016 stop:1201 length:186 start_codon:yes stop_codon:yes gene_type:complete
MDRDTLDKLIKLREFVIAHHKQLDGRTSPGTAIVKQSSVAHVYESTIRSIDDIIRDHVKFK